MTNENPYARLTVQDRALYEKHRLILYKTWIQVCIECGGMENFNYKDILMLDVYHARLREKFAIDGRDVPQKSNLEEVAEEVAKTMEHVEKENRPVVFGPGDMVPVTEGEMVTEAFPQRRFSVR